MVPPAPLQSQQILPISEKTSLGYQPTVPPVENFKPLLTGIDPEDQNRRSNVQKEWFNHQFPPSGRRMDPVVPQHQPPNNRLYQEQPKNRTAQIQWYDQFLDQKLRIFFDFCQNFGVHEQQFHIVFPAMLKDEAHEYYYDNLAEQGLSFMEMCSRLKMHFETEERKYELLNQSYDLSLVSHKEEPGIINSGMFSTASF
ncbi:hypothetical protein GcM3_184040 [Golovinomyces cichoracearum]|uniref:Integrase and RNaseH domain-containing protein n=1 Tax=Golovinomyces cichoracearum TaxID=62708 RepID=A0A420HKU7_9PEZI|nr:hypothetical protein GcM3_184040 [Golovinomyces cichoracearum]